MQKEDITLTFLFAVVLSLVCFIVQSKQIIVRGQVNQGTDCNCPASTYFGGTVCVSGTLSCPNTVSDPICGCDGLNYLNSCIANSNGVKKFTKDVCSTVSNLSCTSDAQCPSGTCPSGKIYKKFTCGATNGSNTNKCTLIEFATDPCPIVSSSGGEQIMCKAIFSNCSCEKECQSFIGSFQPTDCGHTCTPEEISTYEPDCQFVGTSCVDTQGDKCMCSLDNYFDGMLCVIGMLDCLNPVLDPVCGCDKVTYVNSCAAQAAGVKNFTKGKCTSVIVSNCSSNKDCPLGTCTNGNIYKKFNCVESKCTDLALSVNPCLVSSSSSSGGITTSSGATVTLNSGFTGVWKVSSSRCIIFLASSSSSSSGGLSSSGNCISCPNIKVICPKTSIFVPQTCTVCAHCDDCKNPAITFALCVKDNKLDGIINHERYLDRATVKSQKVISENEIIVTLTNPSLLSPQQGVVDTPVDLTLKLIDKRRLVGLFDNMLYFQNIRAKKVSKTGCFSTNFGNDCCNGFITSSRDTICPQGFFQSPCLLAGKSLINVCCPTSPSCSIPCGSNCCTSGGTCVNSDPCFDKNPFCYAPSSLACQNCSSQASCINGKSCPSGTACSDSPDFLCYPIGCPALLK